jgi:maleylacetate reductase
MLPNVLTWNAGVNGEQQAVVSEAMGRPGVPAGVVVREFIASLGLPNTLRDVGIQADKFDLIATTSMHDPWVHSNPRKITGPEQVRELLDMAA